MRRNPLPDPPAIEPLLSMVQISIITGIPVATLKAWVRKGYGPPSFKIGKHRRYPPAGLRGWLEEQERGSAT